MECVQLRKTGSALSNLKHEHAAPIPTPLGNQVLVRVGACRRCHRDILDRKGAYPNQKTPVVPGHEMAGEIVQVGAGVLKWAVGDRVVNLHSVPCGTCKACKEGEDYYCSGAWEVYGISCDGGYAEYVLCGETSLVALPAAIPYHLGCFLHCTAAVALRALQHHAQLRAGQRLLITGCTGGVGMHAIQIARHIGATVVAVTSSRDKQATLRDHGASEVIVSDGTDFEKLLSEPVDVVLELVGGPTFRSSLRCLTAPGRMVLVGNITTSRVQVNPGFLIMNEISIHGCRGATKSEVEQVFRMVEQGYLKPILSQILPLKDAAKAQVLLEKRQVTGRIVLVPSSSVGTNLAVSKPPPSSTIVSTSSNTIVSKL